MATPVSLEELSLSLLVDVVSLESACNPLSAVLAPLALRTGSVAKRKPEAAGWLDAIALFIAPAASFSNVALKYP